MLCFGLVLIGKVEFSIFFSRIALHSCVFIAYRFCSAFSEIDTLRNTFLKSSNGTKI